MADCATDLLAEIVATCACHVSVNVNQHRNYYESVEEYFIDGREGKIEPSVLAEMVSRNTIVEVQAYPKTPVGFIYVAHYDLLTALRKVLECAKEY